MHGDAKDESSLETQGKHPNVFTLSSLKVKIPESLCNHLTKQYGSDQVERIIDRMKIPPSTTCLRVNTLVTTRDDMMELLIELLHKISNNESPQMLPHRHEHFDDCILIPSFPRGSLIAPDQAQLSLHPNINDTTEETNTMQLSPKRLSLKCWPRQERVIIVDRLCGEAVLRGSDIFVRGIMVADSGVVAGEIVSVYADIGEGKLISRGIPPEKFTGDCVFLGKGKACCKRAEMFNKSTGIGVDMSIGLREGPHLPPLPKSVLGDLMMLQNLPSLLVGRALDPQPGDVVLDMCCAPGGKTCHIAALMKNDGLIVACDRSRKKMLAAKEFYLGMKATCITPIALNSTNCVRLKEKQMKSVKEIILSAKPSSEDELLDIKSFYPESFDRILLDPPCSALGLRPKLKVNSDVKQVESHARYQQKFIAAATSLLKIGGTLTYSTCTINASENEKMVRFILDTYSFMSLVPIPFVGLGLPGQPGVGLNDCERHMVRRFDPTDLVNDTMGFFVAKFVKIGNGD